MRLSDRLESTYVVQIRSISELAPGSPRRYGISFTDVRFAIELENEVATNWVGRTDNCGSKNRHMPKTMDEVWKYYSTRPETWSQD